MYDQDKLFTYKWTLYLKPCPRTDWCKKKDKKSPMRCEVEVNLRCLFEIVPVQMRDILLKNGSPGLLYPRCRCSTSSSHPLFFLAWWQLQTPIPRWIVRGSPPQQTDVWGCQQFSSLDQQSLYKTGPKLTLHIQIYVYILYPICKLYEACLGSSWKVCNTRRDLWRRGYWIPNTPHTITQG